MSARRLSIVRRTTLRSERGRVGIADGAGAAASTRGADAGGCLTLASAASLPPPPPLLWLREQATPLAGRDARNVAERAAGRRGRIGAPPDPHESIRI